MLEIELPLLHRIDLFPPLCYATDLNDMLEESNGGRNVAEVVCWLTGVMGDELNGVLEGPVLGFGCLEQNGQLRGSCKHFMEPTTGRRKVENVRNRSARAEDVKHELSCEILEQHVGNARVLDNLFFYDLFFCTILPPSSINLPYKIYPSSLDVILLPIRAANIDAEVKQMKINSSPPLLWGYKRTKIHPEMI